MDSPPLSHLGSPDLKLQVALLKYLHPSTTLAIAENGKHLDSWECKLHSTLALGSLYFPPQGSRGIYQHCWGAAFGIASGACVPSQSFQSTIDFETVTSVSQVRFFPSFHMLCMAISEKAMAPHSSTLAWKIPWAEEPGRLRSMGSLRVGRDWATSLSLFTFMHWRRKWQPTPVFLPGESQGRGSLVGCRLWGRTESDTTEVT